MQSKARIIHFHHQECRGSLARHIMVHRLVGMDPRPSNQVTGIRDIHRTEVLHMAHHRQGTEDLQAMGMGTHPEIGTERWIQDARIILLGPGSDFPVHAKA